MSMPNQPAFSSLILLRSLCVAVASTKAVTVSESACRNRCQSSRLVTMAWYWVLNRAAQVGQRDQALGGVAADPGAAGDDLVVVYGIDVEDRWVLGQLGNRPLPERLLCVDIPLRLGMDVIGQQVLWVGGQLGPALRQLRLGVVEASALPW